MASVNQPWASIRERSGLGAGGLFGWCSLWWASLRSCSRLPSSTISSLESICSICVNGSPTLWLSRASLVGVFFWLAFPTRLLTSPSERCSSSKTQCIWSSKTCCHSNTFLHNCLTDKAHNTRNILTSLLLDPAHSVSCQVSLVLFPDDLSPLSFHPHLASYNTSQRYYNYHLTYMQSLTPCNYVLSRLVIKHSRVETFQSLHATNITEHPLWARHYSRLWNTEVPVVMKFAFSWGGQDDHNTFIHYILCHVVITALRKIKAEYRCRPGMDKLFL